MKREEIAREAVAHTAASLAGALLSYRAMSDRLALDPGGNSELLSIAEQIRERLEEAAEGLRIAAEALGEAGR